MADQNQQPENREQGGTQPQGEPPTPPKAAESQPQAPPPQPRGTEQQPSGGEQQGQRQRGGGERRHRQRPRFQGQGRRQEQHQHQEGGNDVSIVIPLYNEEQSLRELYEHIRDAQIRSGRLEIIFVDDGSTDGSVRVLHELRNRDRRVKIIRFRRNYGKSAALSVGFAHAEGDIIVTMDADLQDDPSEIPNLIREVKKGYDLVSGWKKKRRDPLTKTIPSRFFNFITSFFTGIKIHDFNCGLKAYRKDVAKEVKIYGELHRYIPVPVHWLGYKVGEVPVVHNPRKYGRSKYGMVRFWRGFLDLLTVLFTTRYLQRPLHLFGFWGAVFFLAGFGIDLYLGYLKFAEGMSLGNRPLFVGGILLIIVGVQFISIGLLGELITKTRNGQDKEYSIREIWK